MLYNFEKDFTKVNYFSKIKYFTMHILYTFKDLVHYIQGYTEDNSLMEINVQIFGNHGNPVIIVENQSL